MTLEEAWKEKRLQPPFYARLKSVKDRDIKIVRVTLTQKEVFIYEESDLNLTCHHLEIVEVCESFISPFNRTERNNYGKPV